MQIVVLMKNIKYICAILALAVVVLSVSLAYAYATDRSLDKRCEKQYQFLNREAICGKPDVLEKTGYLETQRQITAYINDQKRKGAVSDTSVYFLDLIHGPSFDINSQTDFAPASLLKLPLAFVFFTIDEMEPGVVNPTLTYTGTSTMHYQSIKPESSAVPGQEYTIEELLRFMIVHSDNASYEVLEKLVAGSPQATEMRKEVFQELGLIDPKDRVESTMSVRGYAGLFRVLFNASYLNTEHSEKLLSWLASTDFKDGLEQGVPSSTVVAHKFGERVDLSGGIKQLHDCGIIYYPGNPYLLCVMTRGVDFTDLRQTIGTISSMIYTEVDSRKIR